MNSYAKFWAMVALLLGDALSWGQGNALLEPARHPRPNPSGEEVSTTTPSETKAEEGLDGIPVYDPESDSSSGVVPAYDPYSSKGGNGLPDGGSGSSIKPAQGGGGTEGCC